MLAGHGSQEKGLMRWHTFTFYAEVNVQVNVTCLWNNKSCFDVIVPAQKQMRVNTFLFLFNISPRHAIFPINKEDSNPPTHQSPLICTNHSETMPALKQLTCSIELGTTNVALTEYGTEYGDGNVSTFVAVPSDDVPFSIHLQSSGYIAPGLAIFVFIDGQYQCNRNRRGMVIPDADTQPSHYEVDLRVRQKESKQPDGTFLGRAWTFNTLNIGMSCLPYAVCSADLIHAVPTDKAPKVSPTFLQNIGNIEVVVLRCKDGQPPPASSSHLAQTQIHKPLVQQTQKAPQSKAPSVKSAKASEAGKAVSEKGSEIGGLFGLFDGPADFLDGNTRDPPYGVYDHLRSQNGPTDAGHCMIDGIPQIFTLMDDSPNSPGYHARQRSTIYATPPPHQSGRAYLYGDGNVPGPQRLNPTPSDWAHTFQTRARRPYSITSTNDTSSCTTGDWHLPSDFDVPPPTPPNRKVHFDARPSLSRRPPPAVAPIPLYNGIGLTSAAPTLRDPQAFTPYPRFQAGEGGVTEKLWEPVSRGPYIYPYAPQSSRTHDRLPGWISHKNTIPEQANVASLADFEQTTFQDDGDEFDRKWRARIEEAQIRDAAQALQQSINRDHKDMEQSQSVGSLNTNRSRDAHVRISSRKSRDEWSNMDNGAPEKPHSTHDTGKWPLNSEHQPCKVSWGNRPNSPVEPTRISHGDTDTVPGAWVEDITDDNQQNGTVEAAWNNEPQQDNEGARNTDNAWNTTGGWENPQADAGHGGNSVARSQGVEQQYQDQNGAARQDQVWMQAGNASVSKKATIAQNTARTEVDKQFSQCDGLRDGEWDRAARSRPEATTQHQLGRQTLPMERTRDGAESPVYLKPYWSDWKKAPETLILEASQIKRVKAHTPYIAPAESLPPVPQDEVEKRKLQHQVRAGQAAPYSHLCAKPEYLDAMTQPYAVFSFKYRSKKVIEEMFNVRIKDDGVHIKAKYADMARDELVEELVRLKVSSSIM